MIPISVRMSGWMRYREEQVADFSGGRLIAICGENGAGKSSIFDAIVFALYGRHRLGKHQASQLISEDLDRLSVEFEFETDGERYLVRRSRTKKAGGGDQGLWIWDEGASDWTNVPGTEKEDGLDRTVAQVVRLSYEAFTSSFILQQNEATEFLDADPKPRFEIISSLIGLKEYETLEKSAKDAARFEKRELEELKTRLAEFEDVDESALAARRTDVERAGEREKLAAVALDRARSCLHDAQRYNQRLAEIAALEQRIAKACELIVDKERIERDADLYKQFSEGLARVGQIRACLEDAVREESAAAAARRDAAAIDLDALQASHDDAARQVRESQQAAGGAEKARDDAASAEHEARDFLVIAKSILDGRKRADDCEKSLAGFDNDLRELPQVEEEARTLGAIVTALPSLRVLKDARAQLEKLGRDDASGALAKLEARHGELQREAKSLAKELQAAEKSLASARRELASCEALVRSLEEQRAQRAQAAAEATCSRCGQPIDPERAREQLRELDEQMAGARDRAEVATAAERDADAATTSVRERQQANVDAAQRCVAEIADVRSRAQQAERARRDDQRALAAFVDVAPEQLAQRVAANTTASALTKLLAAHGDVPKRATAAQRRLEDLRGIEGRRSALVAERERVRDELARAESRLNGRIDEVPQAQHAYQAAKQALSGAGDALKRAREHAESARKREEAARDAVAKARERRAKLESDAAQRDAAAEGHRKTAAAFASNLGEIGEHALSDPAGTTAALEENREKLAGAPERLEALRQAESERVASEAQRDAKREEIAGIPEQHRIDIEQAEAARASAEAESVAARDAHVAAQRDLASLEERLRGIAEMRERRGVLERRQKLLKKLVKLLGKDGLQGALVTDALNQITNHANAFLRRLTGGSLQLSIKREGGDSLELRAVDATCMREPRSVKVLSGSQKFRCAVAIASGIGQYAGAGGMRSIVIDEGFASLDQASQQLMVDELKELASHMDKVIVVSHLEAFTNRDNFPDQLIVEAAGEGSRIRRVY